MLLNNQWISEEIKEEIKNTWRKWKQRHNDPKSIGWSKSNSKRENYSKTSLLQGMRNIPNTQPNLTHKGSTKKQQTKPKVTRKKEILMIRAETNEIET